MKHTITKEQYDWAVSRVEELLDLPDDKEVMKTPEGLELQVLSELVANYSEEHFSIGKPKLVDVIRLRMYEMGITQIALSKLLGVSPSRISEYLSGKSEPTLQVARLISQKLNINADIVLGV